MLNLLRARVVGVTIVCVSTMVWAQPKEASVASVLGRLKSANWQVRDAAVEETGKSPALIGAPAVRHALLELLDRENKWYRDPRPALSSEAEEEAFGQYYGHLLGRVLSFVNPSDFSAVEILVQSVYNADSPLALTLARYGQPVVVPLLKLSSDEDPERRPGALEVLGRTLRNQRLGTRQFPLTQQAIQDVETRLRSALNDPLSYVRLGAITGVKIAGDMASLPILEQLRASDPYTIPNTMKHLIRDEAAEAIAAIKADPLAK